MLAGHVHLAACHPERRSTGKPYRVDRSREGVLDAVYLGEWGGITRIEVES